MRRSLLAIWICTVISTSGCLPATATSVRPLALQGAVTLGIEAIVGGGLAEDLPGRVELFDSDPSRVTAFERGLRELARKALTDAGYEPIGETNRNSAETGAKVDGWVSIEVFGRPVRRDGNPAESVFLVKVSATRAFRHPGGRSEDTELVWSREVIGVAADASLEHELRRVAAVLLDDLIGDSEP